METMEIIARNNLKITTKLRALLQRDNTESVDAHYQHLTNIVILLWILDLIKIQRICYL